MRKVIWLLCSGFLWLSCTEIRADGVLDQQLPDFYQQIQPQTYPLSWQQAGDLSVAAWREQGRRALRQALLWPDEAAAFAPELIKTEQRDGYQAQLWSVQLTAQSRVNVFVLQPGNSEPKPAVLLLHDHGARFDIGKEKWIKPFAGDERGASAAHWADKYFSGNFVGDELAKRGYVVVAADTFGWSDRGPLAYDAQQALASNFYLLGRSLAGMAAYEDLRLVQFIRQLSGVDTNRIAVLGFSMGAYKAWQLAALTDDIKAAVAVSWLNSYQHLLQRGNNILRGQSSFYMLHPGLAATMDIPDMVSLAAPKAMLFIHGAKDTLMPQPGVEYAFSKMQSVWQAFAAKEQLQLKIWPQFGHEFSALQQQQVYDWLSLQLAPAH